MARFEAHGVKTRPHHDGYPWTTGHISAYADTLASQKGCQAFGSIVQISVGEASAFRYKSEGTLRAGRDSIENLMNMNVHGCSIG
jgi:hypothetical protein